MQKARSQARGRAAVFESGPARPKTAAEDAQGQQKTVSKQTRRVCFDTVLLSDPARSFVPVVVFPADAAMAADRAAALPRRRSVPAEEQMVRDVKARDRRKACQRGGCDDFPCFHPTLPFQPGEPRGCRLRNDSAASIP